MSFFFFPRGFFRLMTAQIWPVETKTINIADDFLSMWEQRGWKGRKTKQTIFLSDASDTSKCKWWNFDCFQSAQVCVKCPSLTNALKHYRPHQECRNALVRKTMTLREKAYDYSWLQLFFQSLIWLNWAKQSWCNSGLLPKDFKQPP